MSNTLYSKHDLSDLLKLSVSTIDNKMNSGELEFYKIGKSVRFDDDMINEFLSKQTAKKYKRKHFAYKHRNKDMSGFANAFAKVNDGVQK
tara:strand:- start:393 stop:662 length:270 start_codon:yes stop_codon:yes gene_type:complete